MARVGNYRPVVIIGAPRSGTNMLRDVLSGFDDAATWPCDEINYIWRYGNARQASDEFTPDLVSTGIADYIRRQFEWISDRYNASLVIEKTCANSLRIEFVDRIVPEARYVVIRRHGVDAAASALDRWRGSVDPGYLMRKARFVPLRDLHYYLFRFVRRQLYRRFSGRKMVSSWGPRMAGMEEVLARHSLEEVCMLQWKRCVDLTDRALSELNRGRYIEVKYETFVNSPLAELGRLAEFLEMEVNDRTLVDLAAIPNAASVGRGTRRLSEPELKRMRSIGSETLSKHGYT